MMNKKVALWCTAGALCVSSVTALAAVSDVQKGSLLIYPRIDVTPGKTTLVQITNDANRFINIQCYWMDAKKEVADFELQLSHKQTLIIDAATGAKSVGGVVSRFPQSGPRVGELVCWAVESGIRDRGTAGVIDQVAWNHLLGKGTVIDFVSQDAFDYGAFASRALGVNIDEPVGTAGVLELNNNSGGTGGYDACPSILVGQFSPVGAVLAAGGSTVAYVANKLTVVSCTQDLRQDRLPIYTKLNWTVYNDDEVSFTGAWACSDSWFQTWLGDKVSDDYANSPWYGPSDPDGWQYFVAKYIQSNAASYRLWSTPSTVCGTSPQVKVGLLAVQASWFKLGMPLTWDPITYQPDGTPNPKPYDRIKSYTDGAVGYGLTGQPATIPGTIQFDPREFGTKQ